MLNQESGMTAVLGLQELIGFGLSTMKRRCSRLLIIGSMRWDPSFPHLLVVILEGSSGSFFRSFQLLRATDRRSFSMLALQVSICHGEVRWNREKDERCGSRYSMGRKG